MSDTSILARDRTGSTSERPPVVSIVIPHYNDLCNLARCLDAIRQQTPSAPSYEVIVADNDSPDLRPELEALCRGRARLIFESARGAAAARNAGVEASSAGCLAFIDSDCLPAPGWLEAGVGALQFAPLIGGRIDVSVTDKTALTAIEAFECVFAFNNERYIREDKFSVTANMFTTRAVFDSVGDFRNEVSEDKDWGQRAVALGYFWRYAPEALLKHPARRSWPELTRKWQRLSRESFQLDRKNGRGRAYWLARNWLMMLSLPLALMTALASGKVSSPVDRLRAATVLVRLRLWRFAEAHKLAARPTI